jgi:Spy/CpxP family protein refolding chaperone
MKNFTNNPLLSVLILLLLTANIVTLTLLWINKGGKREKEPPPPQAGGQAFEFITHELKMDSTQILAYSKLRDEHQAGQKPLQDSIRIRKDELFALLQHPDVSDSIISTFTRRAAEAEQQMDLLTFRHFQKVRALCNPEQQKKFDSIIKDILRRMAPRRQGPPPGEHRRPEGPGPEREGFPPPPNGEDQPPK